MKDLKEVSFTSDSRGLFADSFCGACLNFSREKDSAIPFPRRL